MLAAFVTGPEQLEVKQVEKPNPAPGQVRIRVDYVGLCGSDLAYYFHGANGANVVREPFVLGHELSGRVDYDPDGHRQAGTPITVHPARFGTPAPNYPEHPHLWPGGTYLASAATFPHTQGGLAQYLVVDAPMLRELPSSLPVRRAVLAEPLGVALHALSQAPTVHGKRVLVTGSGSIGLLAIAAVKARGADFVAATDVSAGPLERARMAGADEVYDVTHENIEAEFDVVLECTGVPASVSAAVAAARPAGTVVLVGMMPADPVPVLLAPIGTKELTIVGSFRFKEEIDDAVAFLDEHPSVEEIITHEVTATDADSLITALDLAQDSRISGKVVVRVWP